MDILMFGERKGVRGERPFFAARCDRMAAARPCPLRRRKLRASTAEMRPDGGRKAVPVLTGSYARRQQSERGSPLDLKAMAAYTAQQATLWPFSQRATGALSKQRGRASSQRGAKGQPSGMLSRLGTLPVMAGRRCMPMAARPGAERMSPRVYGCRGLRNSSAVGACSTRCPA